MFIRSLLANKKYMISRRNYLNDYNYKTKKDIDMTVSGSYMNSFDEIKLSNYCFDKYPMENDILELKNKIRKKCKIDKEHEIIIGPGSNGIIQNIIKICFEEKGNLVTPFYTFDQAEYACTACNSLTKRVFMNDDATINFENINNSIDFKTKLVYICNPNNITGIYENVDKILTLASKHKNVLFLIDEGGIEFTNKSSILMYKIPSNILVLRTFSKAYGLANLRLGYLICPKDFYHKYNLKTTIHQVSGVSVFIANKLYSSNDYLKNVAKVNNEKKRIINVLSKKNINFYDSSSNVILTKKVPEHFSDFIKKSNVLLLEIKDQNGINHFRIAIQNKEINDKFIKVLGEKL